jgi:adrenodoxin-NADP+ reductase
VGWYNGLPEYRTLKPSLELAEEVVVLGQGNVALDVARILLTSVEDLRRTDITEYALEELSRSRVKRVRVVGRRGPLQAAFTVKELRELLSLPGVGFGPVDSSLLPGDPSSFPRAQRRILQVLQKGPKTPTELAQRSWELSFLRSPKAFLPSSTFPSRIGAIEFEENILEEPIFSPSSNVSGTGRMAIMPTDLAFRSIGYLSEPIPGFEELGIPFNEKRGLVPNENGRVVRPDTSAASGNPAVRIPGVYTSGWVKRGPTGVIASTMYDAFDTGDRIAHDWVSEKGFMEFGGEGEKHGWGAVRSEAKSRGMRPVSWAEWMKIDDAEKERGKLLGKEREKFTSQREMLSVLE